VKPWRPGRNRPSDQSHEDADDRIEHSASMLL
jgi:hypothetical protein